MRQSLYVEPGVPKIRCLLGGRPLSEGAFDCGAGAGGLPMQQVMRDEETRTRKRSCRLRAAAPAPLSLEPRELKSLSENSGAAAECQGFERLSDRF